MHDKSKTSAAGLTTLLALSCLTAPQASAWEAHGLMTYAALESQPLVEQAPPIRAETLAAFVAATQEQLAPFLDEEEAWARAHYENYPPRPEALRFKAGLPAAEQRDAFLHALRMNPNARVPLYVMKRPLEALNAPLTSKDVATIPNVVALSRPRFDALQDGASIKPIAVVATAADEPDYGLDLGLWEDNGTPQGKAYGFGPQPFGDRQQEFSSQAPFHMGIYYEDQIIYNAAPFLKQTHVEYRIRQCLGLARFAFAAGHPYWGYRFMGWGMHYLQDLSQPYHASILPGVSTAKMLFINALSMLGVNGPKDKAVRFVANRHLALENFQWSNVQQAYEAADYTNPLLVSLRGNGKDERFGPYSYDYPRQVVAKRSHDRAVGTDDWLTSLVPSRYVSDESYVFLVTEPGVDLFNVMSKGHQKEASKLASVVSELLEDFGTHTRNFAVFALSGKAAMQTP